MSQSIRRMDTRGRPRRATVSSAAVSCAHLRKRVFHPALWRFTRRSVPRGVALGLLVGIFLLIPGVQIAGVALLALPVRANIPIGAAMTFLSMPATTPFILLGVGICWRIRCCILAMGPGVFISLIETWRATIGMDRLICGRKRRLAVVAGYCGAGDHLGGGCRDWLCARRMVLALVDQLEMATPVESYCGWWIKASRDPHQCH